VFVVPARSLDGIKVVIAGLDPAIHRPSQKLFAKEMDARAKHQARA
jgi:hypothetical protein